MFNFSASKLDELNGVMQALDKSQAIIQFDRDGLILDANRNFLDAVGYSLSEIKGQHHRMFVDPEYARSQDYRKFWENLRSGEYQAAQYKRLGKGGREVWIQASYNPVLDARGNVTKVIKFATDITQQVLENADYKGQIGAIGKSQAVIHFKLDGTILDANQNFLSTLGYSLDEIKGRHHSMFVDTAYAASAEYRNFWDRLRAGEFQAAEYCRIGKGGREVWIQASYNPIFDPEGRPFKVVKYATDITDQVKRRAEASKVGAMVNDKLGEILSSVQAIASCSESAVGASQQTLGTVQTVAAASEELSSSIREISNSVSRSTQAVNEAVEHVYRADQQTVSLGGAAQAMSSILDAIQGIAGQINLLALNATIESARAGEAGRGFAVVAGEVKSLAKQVAVSAEEISGKIGSLQEIATAVTGALGAIKSTIEIVQSSVTGVASAIEEQSAVTQDISSSMQSATGAVSNIDSSMGKVREAVARANECANEGIQAYALLANGTGK